MASVVSSTSALKVSTADSPNDRLTVTFLNANRSSGTVYYKAAADVSASSNDGSLAPGAALTLDRATTWFLAAPAADGSPASAQIAIAPQTEQALVRRPDQTTPNILLRVDPSSGFQSSVDHGTSWRTPGPLFNVKDYGAKGDGTTDDTAAIQAADAAAAAGGGKTFVPAGNFKLTSTLSLAAPMEGVGRIFGAFVTLIQVTASHVSIRGVTLENNHTSGCNGVDIATNVVNTRVVGCRLVCTSGNNMQAVNANATGVAGVLVQGCTFDGVAYGFLSNSTATDLEDVRIIGNRMVNVYGDGVAFNHPGAALTGIRDALVSGNYIACTSGSSAGSGFGVSVAGGSRVTVTGNTFKNCRSRGIHIEDECAHVTISGNVIDGTGNSPATGANSGIYILDGDYISVVGNTIYNCTGSGIQTEWDGTNTATSTVISGNTVKGCGGEGIKIAGSNTPYVELVIANNICVANTGAGIRLVSAPERVQILGNRCTGNTGYGLRLPRGWTGLTITDNALDGNTGGDILLDASLLVATIQGQDRITTAAITTNVSAWVNLFQLGIAAKGPLVVNCYRTTNGGIYSWGMYDISWDGTTLTTTTLKTGNSGGTMTTIELRASGGYLQARINDAIADGTSETIAAHLHGTVGLR